MTTYRGFTLLFRYNGASASKGTTVIEVKYPRFATHTVAQFRATQKLKEKIDQWHKQEKYL